MKRIEPGALVRSVRQRAFDLITPDLKSWITLDPDAVCLVLPMRDSRNSEPGTWVRVLTPSGIGDCYYDDVERI